MKRFWTNIVLVLCVFTLLALSAVAQPTGGETTVGPSERGTESTSGTATLQAGNVTEINITGTKITTKWGGFYGFVSGGVELNDASGNNFYVWTISDFTGAVVYAANNTVSSWTLSAISNTTAPAFVVGEAADDYDQTFTATEAFVSDSMNVAATPYTTTYQNGVVGALKTYGLVVTANPNVNIWAGVVIDDTDSFKVGEQVDYQILAPAKATGTVYNFYLEMP